MANGAIAGPPLTGERMAAFLSGLAGQPYWYGTHLSKATHALLRQKEKQYPVHYGRARTAKYLKDIENKLVCADCVGCIKGYVWTGGGVGVMESIGTDQTYAMRYASGGCPDVTADGMHTFAKRMGAPMGALPPPPVPGVALYKRGHLGVYLGDGWVIEWPGFAQGSVRSQIAARDFIKWFSLPFIDYGGALFY